MNEALLEKIHIDLADSELISYSLNNEKNNLIVQIRLWNGKIVEFTFFDRLFVLDKGTDAIISLYKNMSNTQTFNEVISKNYEKVPLEHPYKLFQFINLNEEPCLEIICENFIFNFLD